MARSPNGGRPSGRDLAATAAGAASRSACTGLRGNAGQRIRAAPLPGYPSPMVPRFALLIAAVVVLLLVGLLLLGAFPPSVAPVAVERSLPNDRFQTR